MDDAVVLRRWVAVTPRTARMKASYRSTKQNLARVGPTTPKHRACDLRASVDHTDARKATIRRFGRSHRRARCYRRWPGRLRCPPLWEAHGGGEKCGPEIGTIKGCRLWYGDLHGLIGNGAIGVARHCGRSELGAASESRYERHGCHLTGSGHPGPLPSNRVGLPTTWRTSCAALAWSRSPSPSDAA
jgi:hypothetical protein